MNLKIKGVGKMIKYAIKLNESEKDAHFIFHATPNSTDYVWQWYITDDKSTSGKAIQGQRNESFTITTELIKERGYDGLYLYCEYTDRKTDEKFKTEFIRLYDDINKIVESGTKFTGISTYNENGNIVDC